MRINLNPNEIVVKASDSKHYNDTEVTPGKLILTNQRLLFASGEDRITVSIIPACISEILPFHAGFFSQKGLNVVMKDGNETRFTVNDSGSWTRLINKMY